jgi:hypothetical protein
MLGARHDHAVECRRQALDARLGRRCCDASAESRGGGHCHRTEQDFATSRPEGGDCAMLKHWWGDRCAGRGASV